VSAVFNTSYLPSIEYLKLISNQDKILIDCSDLWKKKTVRNRAFILSPNGVQCLSVPVTAKQNVSKISDVKIDNSQAWIRVHKGALGAAYNTAPFFEFFKDDLWAVYDKKHSFLIDLNQDLLQLLLRKFKISVDVSIKSDFEDVLHDYRKLSDNHQNNPIFCSESELLSYNQVFAYKHPFAENLSSLDLLANCGSYKHGW
jgi:hypothetical protein